MEFIIQYEGHSNRGLMSIGMQIGVCGEHGGEPSSVAFFAKIGLDYVSCSPFRWPFLLVLYCLVNTYHFFSSFLQKFLGSSFSQTHLILHLFITYIILLLLPNYTFQLLNGFTILFHL